MDTIPGKIKTGSILGFIGGIISMICLALFFTPEERAIEIMGVYVLVAVLFFAMAGAFTKNGQWSWRVLVFMCFITLAIIGGLMIYDYLDMYAGVVLIIVDALILLDLAFPSSKDWINGNRV